MSTAVAMRVDNDDITGYLFGECIRKLADRVEPEPDEIEAANIELENIGVVICKAN